MDLPEAGTCEPEIEEEPVMLANEGIDPEDGTQLAGDSVPMDDEPDGYMDQPEEMPPEGRRDHPMDE